MIWGLILDEGFHRDRCMLAKKSDKNIEEEMTSPNFEHPSIFRLSGSAHYGRLDLVLPVLTGLSRKKIKALIDEGRVEVNGRKVIIASWETKKGDILRIHTREEKTKISAEKYFLKVIFEDPHLLVVEKEAGIGCEESVLSSRPTMVAIVNAYLKRKNPRLKHHYLGLIHRLDRDTSGLMVYSKTKEANKISLQFKRHQIGRRYLAVVDGKVARDSATLEGFLKKSALLKGGKKVAPSTEESGQLARTSFQVLERYQKATLLEVTLNTGRTHQIRVHLAEMGHPVLGDRVYGAGSSLTFPRQALHAAYLKFFHPVTGEPLEFTSDLPRDLRKLVERLRLKG